MTGTYKI
jgi:hypothetical protein